jgi:hypothetical protein
MGELEVNERNLLRQIQSLEAIVARVRDLLLPTEARRRAA